MRFLPGSPASATSAFSDFAIGIVFLVAWVSPGTFGGNVMPALLLTLLLEFIIIHSSAFLGHTMLSRGPRGGFVPAVALSAFYTLFVVAFALVFKTWWPVVSFWLLTFNRLIGLVAGQTPTGDARLRLQRGWGVTAMAYLGFVGMTTILPVPVFGAPGSLRDVISSGGLWVDEPHRMLAFGFLYFTSVGVSEWFDHRWLPASTLPEMPERPAAG